MANPKDLTGKRFDKLVALYKSDLRSRTSWVCRCDCGNETVRTLGYLMRTGKDFNCGCSRQQHYRLKEDRERTAFENRYKKNVLYANSSMEVSLNEISLDEYISLAKRDCFYCGLPPENSFTLRSSTIGNYTIKYSGIDRILPKYGYIKNNVRPCCLQCNMAKSVYLTSDYLINLLDISDAWNIMGYSKLEIPENDDPILPYFKNKKLRSSKRTEVW